MEELPPGKEWEKAVVAKAAAEARVSRFRPTCGKSLPPRCELLAPEAAPWLRLRGVLSLEPRTCYKYWG
ncbi:unnamed protein product [Pleuronectes platessa]|uniref:Uncharacterized protein n=1 Tax=Pleuronectes platessa TaxID=8262 RepID=A0A9N7U344_PLEPL|nr:unnamed protein product [Pleuronectes platessa]